MARELQPDILVALDVNHDYDAAPLVGGKRFPPLKMGSGFTLSHGAVVSDTLNAMIERAARGAGIPMQVDVVSCGGALVTLISFVFSALCARKSHDQYATLHSALQVGTDTGTDGMAGVLASIDCAATSVGFPSEYSASVSFVCVVFCSCSVRVFWRATALV
jgi:endoglucanase